jgi:hypothetical protein
LPKAPRARAASAATIESSSLSARLNAGWKKELGQALERIRAPESAKAKARIGIDRIGAGDPGEGLELVKSSGLTSEPLLASVQRFAESVAAQRLEEAKREKDPNRASEILRDLQPFEAKMAGIEELRKKLKVDAFTAKLQRAILAAEADNKTEAARVLREVLRETKAPAELARGVNAGCAALEKEQWVEAEQAFTAAHESAPESRIADYGVDVARTFRKKAETRALETIRRDKDGVDDAIAVLAASRKIAPESPPRVEAEKLLLNKLKRAKRLSNKEAAQVIGQVARLSGPEEVLRGAQALEAGDLAAATSSFNAALAKNPKSEIAKIGLERSQSSLTEGVARGDVPIDSEATALVLRGLLEKKPNDENLQAALSKLVDRIEKASDRETVARLLSLAAIASGMKGALRESIDAGAKAIAKGDLEEAERTLAKAVEIDPSSEIARAAFDEVKEARKSDVVKRVVAEHEAGRDDRVKAALQKKLDEGGTVLEMMLAEATRLASLGRDAEAAKILDAANASNEGAAKSAVKRANGMLAAGRHREAEKVYAEHKESSEVAEAGEKIAFTRHIQRLLEGVRALGRLEDLENSAKAAAEIFAIDPRDSDVKKALAKVYERAEQSAQAKNATEMTRLLGVAAVVIGRTEELTGPLRAMRANRMNEASEMLRKLGAEFEQESEEEEAAEREPMVEYTKRARAAIGKL